MRQGDNRCYEATGAKCPTCGHLYEGAWEWENGHHFCTRCQQWFELDKETCITYCTRPAAECPVCQQPRSVRLGRIVRHPAPGKWDDCPGSMREVG